jgi:large conductance mechanosensitive channel
VFSEFKEFIKRGNVMDLAVAVIIGGAFGKIVTSVTDDLIMPVLSLATGKIDFTNLFYALDGKTYATLAEARKAGAATFAYGNFINAVINFLIIAFVIFLLVKQINRLMPPPPPPPPAGPTPTEKLLGEIKDLLARK